MSSNLSKKIRYAHSFWKKRIVHVNLQVLYDCNFRCAICDFWKKPYSGYPRMSPSQVAIIAGKLKKIGPQIVSIGGGEPLLHDRIIDIVAILSKDNFPVMICNGWHVTPELAKGLFTAGMHEISISIDYPDAKRHDRQRGMEGAFDRAVEALRVLNENRAYPHQRVHMISVILDDNLDDIEGLIELSKKIGVTYLVSLYSHSRGKKRLRDSRPEVSEYLLRLKKKYPQFVSLRGYLARFSEAIEKKGIAPCYAGRNLLNIDSCGSVTFCIDNLEDPVGNILTDDIDDITGALSLRHSGNSCSSCWTSCRGSIETLMYGKNFLGNLIDYHRMIRSISLS